MKRVFTLKSGHQLTLNVAEFEEAQVLLEQLSEAAKGVRLDISQDMMAAILAGDQDTIKKAVVGNDVNTIWNLFLNVMSHRGLKIAVGQCMRHCMLNAAGPTEAIVPEKTFNDERARPDYLPIAWEVIKANVGPFFGSLVSASSKNSESTAQSPG